MNIIPTAKIETPKGVETFDVYSALLNSGRSIMLDGEITDQSASLVNAQLLYLSAVDPDEPITLYINSPGGSVSAGLSIYDLIQFISNPVQTVACGLAASMGSFLLSAGEPGRRFALPNATIMMHQIQAGLPQGNFRSNQNMMEFFSKQEKRLEQIYAGNCHKSAEEIHAFCGMDQYMNPDEAKEFGLIDAIISKQGDIPAHLNAK